MKRAKKRKEKREKNSKLFFAKKKGVTSIPRQEVGGIIKVIKKSEVCRALFDAEKVFQNFQDVYIYVT